MASDLATLSVLCEHTLLEQLTKRYVSNKIYTYVADILVAVNPYKQLDIFTESVSADYNGIGGLVCKDPHIFALADTAYQMLKRSGKRQCFLISGESGAGKTESTKLVLQHILRVSRHKRGWLQDTITQLNPILEAFGNAKTVMNNNSSRFGKYIQLITEPDGVICGVNVSQYMLERSRLVKRNPGDLNFHIFYYLFGGLNKSALVKYLLVKPSNHRYLMDDSGQLDQHPTTERPKVQFEELVLALSDVGFTNENISTMWRVIAAVLHVGDIKFTCNEDTDQCHIRTPTVLKTVCTLLNVEECQLSAALTSTVTITRGESIRKYFNLRKCESARDGLAKALYGRLFDWIVDKINILSNDITPNKSHLSIDILDIFGFENFAENSFEQLCINIANEQLQYFFNQHVFTWEQVEYENEGIQTELVSFNNNERILDLLLTRPTGMLQLLDEESRLARGSETSLIQKMGRVWGKHPNLTIPRISDTFIVTHYAGQVSYKVEGMLEKNRDTLSLDIVKCITNSRDTLVTEMFCGVLTHTGTLRHTNLSTGSVSGTIRKSTLRRRQSGNMTLSRPGKGTIKKKSKNKTGGGQTKKKEPTSVAIFFRNSLKELMKKILESEPHFIRCIKPNSNKTPMCIDKELIEKQLKYTGVLETTKIRQLGYSHRVTFGDFIAKYGMLVNQKPEHVTQLQKIEHMLTVIDKQDGWCVGHTKVFLKYWFVEHLDKMYDAYIGDIICVQKLIRGFIQRRRFQKMKAEEDARRLETERKQEEMLEALQAEQRLKEHLESIRTLTETCERAGTLALKRINLSDLTSAIFDTDLDDENPIVSPQSTIERSKTNETLSTESGISTNPDTEALYWMTPDNKLSDESPIDNTPAAVDQVISAQDGTKVDNIQTPQQDISDSKVDNIQTPKQDISASKVDNIQMSKQDISASKVGIIQTARVNDELMSSSEDYNKSDHEKRAPFVSMDDTRLCSGSASEDKSDTFHTSLDVLDSDESCKRDTFSTTLDSLDRTLASEMEKLARWSMDCEYLNIGLPTTLQLSHGSRSSTIDTTATPIADLSIERDPTPTESFIRESETKRESESFITPGSVSYVSTFSLDTLDKEEEEVTDRQTSNRLSAHIIKQEIKSGQSSSSKDHSLKLTHALSNGEISPLSPGYINTASDGRALSPGEFQFPSLYSDHVAAESEQQDSGIEMQRYDSLDSKGRRSSSSSFDVVRTTSESGTSSLDSRSLRHKQHPCHSNSPLIRDPNMSSGGIQSASSMQSFDELNSSSPIPSECSPSPDRISNCASVSSMVNDLPNGRARSAASNISDTILTTLDRPRTRSFTGAPAKQGWLQVVCCERDIETGKFLIDKPKVQIDGQMMHPDAVKDPDLYRISLTGLLNKDRQPKTEKMLPEIGQGILITRDKNTGDVTLTKVCRKDVFILNESFLEIKQEEKSKGKHIKMEHNTVYTIFNKQKFIDDVRSSAIDLSHIHTIGQVAIAFLKVNNNTHKGVPCWVKVQCLEAMNLLKNILAGTSREEREWLRKASPEPVSPPRRLSKSRLSFGSKSSSKASLKDSKSSINSDAPIPRCKSKSQLFRNSKKTNTNSPDPKSHRYSSISQHLEPIEHNYNSIYDMMEDDTYPPESQFSPRGDDINTRRTSSPADYIRKNFTTADVSSPLGLRSPNS